MTELGQGQARPSGRSRWTAVAAAIALGASAAPVGAEESTIPFGTVAKGHQDITAAWLSEPTDDYPHGVLGDEIEARTLVVRTQSGQTLSYRLEDAVFEDNTPRLADIDQDGRDEVWSMISDMVGGARLAAFGVSDGKLELRFQTAPIGIGFRWLNPLAVDDFDGDGTREAAYIETPHIGGILTIVRPVGDRLEPLATRSGYSTHSMGSPHLDLGVSANVDGKPGAEIILPTQSRNALAVVAFDGKRLKQLWVGPRGPGIAGGLSVSREGEHWVASYNSRVGERVRVQLPAL